MILSKDIQNLFYSKDGIVKEKFVEETYCNLFKQINPDLIIEKKQIGHGTPDGFIVFQDGNSITWIPQEVKRDIGASPETIAQMFLQDMMTAGHFLYNLNPFYGRFNFGGLILSSMQFFTFINKQELEKCIDSFEPLWIKYCVIPPSSAFNIKELAMWARETINMLDFKIYYLWENIRLDLVLKEIFKNGNYTRTTDAGKSY